LFGIPLLKAQIDYMFQNLGVMAPLAMPKVITTHKKLQGNLPNAEECYINTEMDNRGFIERQWAPK